MNHPGGRRPVEPLEPRTLLAAWGPQAGLINLDDAITHFPGITGAGQTVAVIDTGVDYRHPALGGGFGPGYKVVGGYDFVDNDSDPMSPDGHGTGVAGIIAAGDYTFGGYRYRGLAPGVKIVALRVEDGSDDDTTFARIRLALQWVLGNRAKYNIVAVNISLGSGDYENSTSNGSLSFELSRLVSAGVFVAAATGNNGVTDPPSIIYPAADDNAYAVGSINTRDIISSFTRRSDDVDLLAPGEDVAVPYYDGRNGKHVYLQADGTSFAVPHVAAAAALLKQINPAFTSAQILDILQDSGVSNFDGDNESGRTTGLTYKRLDLDAALKLGMQRRPDKSGTFNSVAFDSAGNLHLAYYDTLTRSLWYALRKPDRTWTASRSVDASRGAGWGLSLAIDHKNRPAIAYYAPDTGDLRYASYFGGSFHIYTVDRSGNTGLSPSLVFTPSNRPAISYYNYSSGDLRVAVAGKRKWSISAIEPQFNTGRFSSIAIDPSSNRLAVAYTDDTHDTLRFAANYKSRWFLSTVAKTGRGAAYVSLAFYSTGRPAVSYYDLAKRDLIFAQRERASAWSIHTLASNGSQGKFSTLLIDPANHKTSIIFYSESARAVSLATLANGSWTFSQQATNAGLYLSAAQDRFSKIAILWRDRSTGLLKDKAV